MIYGGASTFSKMHCNYPENFPSYADFCDGQHIFAGGEMYFDTVSALGSQLLDYSHGPVSYSLPSIYEKQLAEKICDAFPFVEMVRYGCNGADATEGAIRYARNYTGRKDVLSVGYHSCQSPFTYNTPPACGCIDGRVLNSTDIETTVSVCGGKYGENVAAVIVEPVMLYTGVIDGLAALREVTAKNGIILIFDEIITGFRVPRRAISNWFGIYPDIMLIGKAVAGGYPFSAICGKREVMDTPVFHSYTFAGFTESIIRAVEMFELVTDKSVGKFWDLSGKWFDWFNKKELPIKLKGYNTRGVWDGEKVLVYTFWQEMLKKGYFIGPAYFPRITWTDVDYKCLFETAVDTINEILSCGITLKGRVPHPIFKRS